MNVLFLTGPWHYSELRAGVAVTPGPLAAALASAGAGRTVKRVGAQWVATLGCLSSASGALLLAVRLTGSRDYVAHFLPSALLTGAGVGSAFSAVISRRGRRPATHPARDGGAVAACLRQVGAVLGVAVLVAALAGRDVLDASRPVYLGIAVTGSLAGLLALAIPRDTCRVVPVRQHPGSPGIRRPAGQEGD